jgi:F0F1-type ATP synthase assembly protein I
MQFTPDDPKELGRYLALANVGLEMVAPIGIGVALDYYLDWSPWGAAGGAVFGLVLGLYHVTVMSKNEEARERRDQPPPRNP